MSWTRVCSILPAVLAACTRVNPGDAADAGSADPAVVEVDPAPPGPVQGNAQFTVRFSGPMDESLLLAEPGRSETVALCADADVEQAALALSAGKLSARERALLVPAQAQVAADRASITLVPGAPLAQGKIWLLVSPRLKDDAGRKLAGAGPRFGFDVAAPPATARLVSPVAGGDAPSNLLLVRARAASGRVSLRGLNGDEVASADAHGDVALSLGAALASGARYTLALGGVEDPSQAFTVAPCTRNAAPALEGGAAVLSARDTAVTASLALDWPSQVEVRVGPANSGEPCSGPCVKAAAYVACAVPACGPQSFDCKLALTVAGLQPAHEYALRAVAQDDLNHETRGPLQQFSTLAQLPRVLISEVMVAPPAPQEEGEYAEIVNLGPGNVVLDSLALVGPDGGARPLTAAPPPLPVQLAPGARALAVGSAFDATRYPSIPPGTPVLRAATQRLLGRGLADDAPPAFQLVLGDLVLAQFPGGGPHCATGASLQRDESVPPEGDAAWTCAAVGGTPGAPP